jgi:signal transduction histidine kinase
VITGYRFKPHQGVLLAAIAALILLVEGLVWQLDKGLTADRENSLLEEASDMRALLEAEISEGIYITIGLESFIRSRDGEFLVSDVERWMATLFENTRHLRNIGIAPDNRISVVFPLEGNEAVIGLKYRDLPAQWPAIERMMASGEPSLIGPVNLVQGGVALIYRRPVFTGTGYWGLISTVMDIDSILDVLARSRTNTQSYYRIRKLETDGYSTIAGTLAPSASRVSQSVDVVLQGDLNWELTVSERRALWPLWSARLFLYALSLLIVMIGWQSYQSRIRQIQANREKIEFIHTISHELRTPLTSISGALVLLQRTAQGSNTADSLVALAIRNAKRLERLINEVLDIARLDASRMTYKIETLSIGPVLKQALENNVSFAQAQGVVLELSTATADQQVCIRADEQRLHQILDNLISNAIKFSDTGQAVVISTKHWHERIDIRIQDFGIGIPSSFQSRLFERFARADHSDTRRNQSGTGLGLSISRELARHMGGDITVKSKIGEGSRFTLELPAFNPPDSDKPAVS